jgi:hypothetical protein
MIDVLGDYCNHLSKMSIVLEYLYSSSMYCYREESFVDGYFLFKYMKKSTPLECMPIHVHACVDPIKPEASSEISPYLHKLKVMLCQLHTIPLIDMSRFTTYLSHPLSNHPSTFANSPTYPGPWNPMSLPYKYNAHVLAVHNFNTVVSPSLPPQTTAAGSAVVLGRCHYSSRYSPGI